MLGLRKVWGRAVRSAVVLALAIPTFAATPAMAVSPGPVVGFTTDNDNGIYVANDHTPAALRIYATGMAASREYKVRASFVKDGGTSPTDDRGFIWNFATNRWVLHNVVSWDSLPTTASDASGVISGDAAGWVWMKFADERTSGAYDIVIQLRDTVTGDVYSSSTEDPSAAVTVLDVADEAAHLHNGMVISGRDNKRADVVDPADNSPVYTLAKSEPNKVDDDNNGIVDDEDRGPAGKNSDYRLPVPLDIPGKLRVNKVDYTTPLASSTATKADEDIALNAADMIAPSAPTTLTVSSTPTTITLDWHASTDAGGSGVAKYNVYRWQEISSNASFTPVRQLIGTSTTTSFKDDQVGSNVTYKYMVRAVDVDTNVSARSNVVEAMLAEPPAEDTIAPITTASGLPDGWSKNPVSVELTATDVGYGVDKTYYRIDSGETTTYADPISITAEGATELEYWSVDRATPANVEATKTATVRIDKTAPAVSLAGTGTAVAPATVTATVTDALSGLAVVRYRVNAGVWTSGTAAVLSTPGAYSVEFEATDNAGNTTNVSGSVLVTSATPIPAATSLTNAGSTIITNGKTATVTGQLSAASLPATATAGKVVSLQYLSGDTWVPTGVTATTGADGSFSMGYKPSANTIVRVAFAGTSELAASTSVQRQISVRANVAMRKIGTQRAGRKFSMYATVAPVHRAWVTFKVYKKSGSSWKLIRNIRIKSSYGTMRAVPKLSAGEYRVRAQHMDADHIKSLSSYRYFTVR